MGRLVEYVHTSPFELVPATWRFSERGYTPISQNIKNSLQRDGQLAPIHTRWIQHERYEMGGYYEIIDGHIVAEMAMEIGLRVVDIAYHLNVTDEQAKLMYIHFNQNRGSEQYGHDHIEIHRTYGSVEAESNTARALLIQNHTSWPKDRIQDYVDIDENSRNWKLFMNGRPKNKDGQQPIPGMEPEVVYEEEEK